MSIGKWAGSAAAGCWLTLWAQAGQVVISEIMYHPPDGLPEYIELQNLTATPLDIANWRFTAGISYEFPSFSVVSSNLTFLKPFERIVVSSSDGTTTRASYSIPSTVRIYGPWDGNLSDGGERLTLKDKNGAMVCSVEYGDRGHWPLAADGAGHSLVLKKPDRTVDDWRNWEASKRRLGTPGTEPAVAAEVPMGDPEIKAGQGLVLVDYGDNWRFHDQNQDLGTEWKEKGYDDSGWSEGAGLFGFETAALPQPGIRTPFSDFDQITYYLRTTFTFMGSPSGVSLSVDQILDDGAVYYLNGKLLGWSGMLDGSPDFTTTSSRTVTDAVEEIGVISVGDGWLEQGTNVLAVEVHQIGSGSSDVVFGARLRASVPVRGDILINEVMPVAGAAGFIEFYNPAKSLVDLKGYFLSDNPGNLTKYQIQESLAVPAGGFASVSYAGSGFSPGPNVTACLTASDGATLVNGIMASAPSQGSSLGRKPAGSSSWFHFATATRNLPNGSADSVAGLLKINEAHFTASNTVDWVELWNGSRDTVSLSGLYLAGRRDFSDKTALQGTVPAGGFASADIDVPADQGEATIFLIDERGVVLDAQLLARSPKGGCLQAFPDGSREWYGAASSTRDAPNAVERYTDVVINEIMYDPPSNQVDGEYIELFNRGTADVDVSGWRITDGVNFRIPVGTIIPAGGYLVVAANLARFRAVYGDIPAVGDFRGRLRNNGDLIRLLDQWGNLADEVDYLARGDWPDLANGQGSSMELLNPWMDNSLSSAWASSDESGKAPLKSYTYRGAYTQLRTMGAATDYKEIYFHLVNEGHVVLEDVQFIKVSAGTNLIVNGDRLSDNGASARGWLCQGTHWASYVDGNALHILAEGRGDNRPNRVEIDVTGMNRMDQCELRFNGRWISGSARLIFSTWDHSIANSFLLEIPENLGTPGRPNSRLLASPAPQVDGLAHSPAVPRSTNRVKVTARIQSVDPLASVEVRHRLDNSNADGAWASKPMYDDGINGGDQVAGDGVYTGELTEYRSSGLVVQFYVRAQTASGQTSVLPRSGAARPAMFAVDNTQRGGDLRIARFVVSQYDINAIANGNIAKYKYRFPPLSNHYKNATFISNDRDIYYNALIRTSGSPWTRGGDLSRGKWKLPEDRRFREQVKFFYDNDPQYGRPFNNRIARYWLYLLGHPVSLNEFIYVIINSGWQMLSEDTEPVANDFLARNFENGEQGDLYRIDDEWWFNDWWERGYRDADWSYKNSDNAGRYRSEWMKRTNEEQDDFSALISFFKTVSGNYTQAEIERLIDPYATMKMFVVRGYIDDWDSFSLSRGKNGFFYRRASDGLFQFMHWDSDLTFGNTSAALYSGVPRVGPYIAKTYNLRIFYYYLAEMMDNYTKDSPRLNAWFRAEEDASNEYDPGSNFFRSWCNTRNTFCRTRMSNNYNRTFTVTTGSGQPIVTGDDTVTIEGSAPVGVFKVEVQDHPEGVLTWSNVIGWTVSGIRLKQGENELRIKALDQWGNIVLHSRTNLPELVVTVNKTNAALPVVVLDAQPASWHVPVGDTLELDGRDSYSPNGTIISFDWSVAPVVPAIWNTNVSGTVTAVFQRPGLYAIGLTVTGLEGRSASLGREASVYGIDGFSDFNERQLEAFWSMQGVAYKDNYSDGSWISLDDKPGQLILQVPDNVARPFTSVAPVYPWIWRALPPQGDWALETKVALEARQFGTFFAGLLAETFEEGATNLYAIGLDDGKFIGVKKVGADGFVTPKASIIWGSGEAVLRIRRVESELRFECRTGGDWTLVAQLALAPGAVCQRGGVFTSTEQAQAVRVGFDYVMLVDPSDTTSLRESLIVSEIMYNPIGGDPYEYVELWNKSSGTIDLDGVRFSEGISCTFQPTVLAPGERIVIAKDLAAFASRYGLEGIRLAANSYSGKLDNGGERLTLVDRDGRQILSFTYGDGGRWPGRPDGFGSSLELVDPSASLDDPDNWRSSAEYNGSPGREGTGPLRTVVINEVLAHSDLPLEDAIELCNPSPNPVDIGGWFLSDDRADYQKYRIPFNTVVPAGGYIVFYEEQFNTNNTLKPFALSSAHGDEIYLVAADLQGNLTAFADAVSFDASANGVSFGRYPDGLGPLVPMALLTFGTDVLPGDPPERITEFRTGPGAPNAEPKVGPVVISQIMYNPSDGFDEYIELSNITDLPVPLFDPAAATNRWRLADAIDYTMPAGVTLGPQERVFVVGISPVTFRAKYQVPQDVRVFGPWRGSLDNAGEYLELLAPDSPQVLPPDAGFVPYYAVDAVEYDNRYPWPTLADGRGAALSRIELTQYGNDPANWRAIVAGEDQDSDGDGMPDEWEQANGLDPLAREDAWQDKDGDGMTNLAEYLSGTDPRDPASCLRLEVKSVTSDTIVLQFTAVADKSYTVEYRDSIQQGAWTRLMSIQAQPVTADREATDSLTGATSARFYRLITPAQH